MKALKKIEHSLPIMAVTFLKFLSAFIIFYVTCSEWILHNGPNVLPNGNMRMATGHYNGTVFLLGMYNQLTSLCTYRIQKQKQGGWDSPTGTKQLVEFDVNTETFYDYGQDYLPRIFWGISVPYYTQLNHHQQPLYSLFPNDYYRYFAMFPSRHSSKFYRCFLWRLNNPSYIINNVD